MSTTTIRIGERPRRWPATLLLAAFVAAVAFTLLADFVIRVQWFREIGQSGVFWTTLRTKALLGIAFGLGFFVLLYANLTIARWIAPTTRVLTPEQEALERIREGLEPYLRWLLPAGSLLLAFFVGLGVAGRQREAVEAYVHAAQADEVSFDALVRLGKTHRVLGEADKALTFFDEAARRRPGSAIPPYERGLLRLARGDFANGWQDYDARWSTDELIATRGFVPLQLIPMLKTAPAASDLVDQRVLLIGDQGIGDQVMFASMLPDLQRTAKSVVCLCEPRLMGLLENAFPAVNFVDPRGAQVDGDSVDTLLAMSSLGSAFRRTWADFPGEAYVKARPDGAARWAERLGERPAGLRVGISWRGGVPQTGRAERSVDLLALRALLETPGCEFISLQYGDVIAEIEQANAVLASPIRSFPPEELFNFQDFADLIENLDLVISVQNATVHLAGAMGKTCVALLPHNPEWRYMSSGSRLPWYASVHLIRQSSPRDWSSVVVEAAKVIDGLCS
ncbi:MAG: UPF0182 family protein [Bryobacteraceae bacterium]|nr:UPF0182 family protein [Bryobacteraceae bacterium]